MVVKDIAQHYHQWGARRFWFTDAQFITGKEAYPQCTEILERILSEKLEIEWSGYIQTSLITPDLAKLMVRSGVGDLEVAITSGSQEVLNNLYMGFKLERLYDGCRYLAEAGFKGKVILNDSLNSPKETEETLLQSVEAYKMVASILGEERVFPLMFFLGIQPNTDLEQRLLEEGYLSAGYNPLMLTPNSIRKLLYNPAPLNKIIAKACLKAWEQKSGSRDPRKWTGSLSQTSQEGGTYADANLLVASKGIPDGTRSSPWKNPAVQKTSPLGLAFRGKIPHDLLALTSPFYPLNTLQSRDGRCYHAVSFTEAAIVNHLVFLAIMTILAVCEGAWRRHLNVQDYLYSGR